VGDGEEPEDPLQGLMELVVEETGEQSVARGSVPLD
jgi:hypothetical protein